jgi:hypothetical protein
MAMVGPSGPGTVTDNGDNGAAWTNPNNMKLDDTNYATVSILKSKVCNSVLCNNFGFTIPSGATVTDLAFTCKRKATTANTIIGQYILVDDTGMIIEASYQADAAAWAITDASSTFSGNSVYWGVTLTPTLLNDVDFGVLMLCENDDVSTTRVASVQYISMTITYTEAAGESAVPVIMSQTRRRRL